jgi:hypothetical protein
MTDEEIQARLSRIHTNLGECIDLLREMDPEAVVAIAQARLEIRKAQSALAREAPGDA